MKSIAIIGKNKDFTSALIRLLKLLEIEYELFFEENIRGNHYYDYIILNNNSCAIKDNIIKLSGKYCFINMDNSINLNTSIFANLITYGFGSKNTVTVSSIEQGNCQFLYCLQRYLNYNNFKMIEPEEIIVNILFKNDEEMYAYMVGITMSLIEDKEISKIQSTIGKI
ncbi:hypothetical protein CLOACE_12650 [Clostridium acetireducens DSM 10703]|uniref:Uncharacterized protein n=1 Tax=Clostridium acetireducens DSM 10703 TaxID=1121290 RepID=A0A1E8EYU1_9CLOT|nr:hypothetical protein [Clostridium acetireducens]OFI06122.1 hypothetical protein CLOACE_12650 [Clostridium acetireducens DSM 10703]